MAFEIAPVRSRLGNVLLGFSRFIKEVPRISVNAILGLDDIPEDIATGRLYGYFSFRK
jgi:hypothetical protein